MGLVVSTAGQAVDLDALYLANTMAVTVNARQLKSSYAFVEPKEFSTARGHGNVSSVSTHVRVCCPIHQHLLRGMCWLV